MARMAGPRIWYDPPPFSWERVLRVGGVWLAVVLVVLLLPTPHSNDRPAVTKRPVEDLPLPYAPAASAAAPRIEATASAPPRTAVAAATATRELEACGGRRLRLVADKPPDIGLLDQVDARELRQRTAAAMRLGSETARAAAPFIEAPGAASLDALAGAAATGQDPRAYAVAFRACAAAKAAARGGACALLSADQWSRLDPDNAVPWQFIAAQAQQRGDAAGVSDAMHRVTKARRSDDGAGILPSLLLQHAPRDDASLLPTLRLLLETADMQAGWAHTSHGAAQSFCSEAAVRDPARRQTCSEIAEVLVQRSSTLLDQANGAVIGKRIGWSDDKVQALRAEREAVAEQAGRALALEGDAFSCAWARRALAHLRTVAEQGELEPARAALRPSGRRPGG
jgi:hypothetical protein